MADLLLIKKRHNGTLSKYAFSALAACFHGSFKGKYKEMKGGFRLLHSSGHMK